MSFDYSFFAEYINIFIHKRDKSKVNLINYDYEIMAAPTKGHVVAPISKKELKQLADFIYKLLEQDSSHDYSAIDDLPIEPRGPFCY